MPKKIKTHDGREFEVSKRGYVKINDYTHWADHLVSSQLATYVEEPENLTMLLERKCADSSWEQVAEIAVDWLQRNGFVKHSEVMRVFEEWDTSMSTDDFRKKLEQLKERV